MNKFERTIYQLTFSADDRIEIYDDFRQYTLDGRGAKNTFEKLIENYTRRGKKPNNPIAQILTECSENLNSGFSLAESLREWIPDQELSAIESSDIAGRTADGFLNATRIAEGSGRLKSAAVSTFAVTTYLLSLMLGIISLICILLVPILKQSIPLEQWSGPQLGIYYIYIFLSEYSLLALPALGLFLYFILWTMPRWTGNLRYHFDKIPPYSIYKRFQGASFIINIDAMLSSGRPMEDSLQRMADSTRSKWLKERLDAAIIAIKGGEGNLGLALDVTGFDFPAPEAIIKMQSLFEIKNNEGSLKRFGDKWLEKTIKSVEKTGETLKIMSMFGSAVGLCTIIAILFSLIQRAFNI